MGDPRHRRRLGASFRSGCTLRVRAISARSRPLGLVAAPALRWTVVSLSLHCAALLLAMPSDAAPVTCYYPTVPASLCESVPGASFDSLSDFEVSNPYTLDGTIPAFDTSLGDLRSVQILLYGDAAAAVTVDVPEAGSWSFQLNLRLNFRGPDGSLLGTSEGNVSGFTFPVATPGPFRFSDGNIINHRVIATQGLAFFLAANSYAIELDFVFAFDDPRLGTLSADTIGGPGIAVSSVTYEYVPEPSTALLVGLGLTGIALRQRRRQPLARDGGAP